jgi:hypothetical protein
MSYMQPEPETPEAAAERQQAALQSVTALREEIVETAPAKLAKGAATLIGIFLVVRWVWGRL